MGRKITFTDDSFVIITLNGASGGSGGNDSKSGAIGTRGDKVTVAFNASAGDVYYISLGSSGSNGSNSVRGTGGGVGGAALEGFAGGTGGNAGDVGTSGGGGGGGGATVLYSYDGTTTKYIAVAAGGGGGGGGGNRSAGKSPSFTLKTSRARLSTLKYTVGMNRGSKGQTYIDLDGGGGGGGGGGFLGGIGGTVTMGDHGGNGGSAGISGVPTIGTTWDATDELKSKWLQLAKISEISLFGSTSTEGSYTIDAYSSKLFNMSSMWNTVTSIKYYSNGWVNVPDAYIMVNGVWEPIFKSNAYTDVLYNEPRDSISGPAVSPLEYIEPDPPISASASISPAAAYLNELYNVTLNGAANTSFTATEYGTLYPSSTLWSANGRTFTGKTNSTGIWTTPGVHTGEIDYYIVFSLANGTNARTNTIKVRKKPAGTVPAPAPAPAPTVGNSTSSNNTSTVVSTSQNTTVDYVSSSSSSSSSGTSTVNTSNSVWTTPNTTDANGQAYNLRSGDGSSESVVYSGSESSSGGGSSGGGKIICTAMNEAYGFGSFRNAIWIMYADKHLSKAHEVGYHTIFMPFVKYAFYSEGDSATKRVVRNILEWGTRHRSIDLRAQMYNRKRDTTGRIIRFIFEPLCYIVGKIKGY